VGKTIYDKQDEKQKQNNNNNTHARTSTGEKKYHMHVSETTAWHEQCFKRQLSI